MGVMACDRNNCDGILCDRLIVDGRYYICGGCWSELCDYKETWEAPMSEAEVVSRITEFMATRPGSTRVAESACDIDSVFRRLTCSEGDD